MRREVSAPRNAAAQAAQVQRIPFREFLDRGLEDVLQDAESNGWPAREMAIQFIEKCCLTEGKFNNFQAGFLAIMSFLNEQVGPPGDQA